MTWTRSTARAGAVGLRWRSRRRDVAVYRAQRGGQDPLVQSSRHARGRRGALTVAASNVHPNGRAQGCATARASDEAAGCSRDDRLRQPGVALRRGREQPCDELDRVHQPSLASPARRAVAGSITAASNSCWRSPGHDGRPRLCGSTSVDWPGAGGDREVSTTSGGERQASRAPRRAGRDREWRLDGCYLLRVAGGLLGRAPRGVTRYQERARTLRQAADAEAPPGRETRRRRRGTTRSVVVPRAGLVGMARHRRHAVIAVSVVGVVVVGVLSCRRRCRRARGDVAVCASTCPRVSRRRLRLDPNRRQWSSPARRRPRCRGKGQSDLLARSTELQVSGAWRGRGGRAVRNRWATRRCECEIDGARARSAELPAVADGEGRRASDTAVQRTRPGQAGRRGTTGTLYRHVPIRDRSM